jgi:hypothetical protein
MNRMEARAVFAGVLLAKARQDTYPSSTQLSLIEEVIPPQLLSRYVEVLLEKVAHENRPSISMLHRISRVINQMPDTDRNG